jgi:hypothetical protein
MASSPSSSGNGENSHHAGLFFARKSVTVIRNGTVRDLALSWPTLREDIAELI